MIKFMAAALAFLLVAMPAIAKDAPVSTIQVNGKTVAWRQYGQGDTILVMVPGLGDGMDSFAKVAPRLGQSVRVIVYDRPGYGGSQPVDGARDSLTAASELDGFLTALHVDRPVIVLGHSIGGLYAQTFAARYPQRVRALILDDSRPAGLTQHCLKTVKKGCELPAWLAAAMPDAARREGRDAQIAEQQAEQAGFTPAPVLILARFTAAKAKGFDRLWADEQARAATRFPHARLATAPAGGHYIHQDQPDWFVTQVTDFVRDLP